MLLVVDTVTDTSGMPGFLASTWPPDVAVTEKLPTNEKSLLMSAWTNCWLIVPLSLSSPAVTTIFRPFTPPLALM